MRYNLKKYGALVSIWGYFISKSAKLYRHRREDLFALGCPCGKKTLARLHLNTRLLRKSGL